MYIYIYFLRLGGFWLERAGQGRGIYFLLKKIKKNDIYLWFAVFGSMGCFVSGCLELQRKR
jgi:hypothetical protein